MTLQSVPSTNSMQHTVHNSMFMWHGDTYSMHISMQILQQPTWSAEDRTLFGIVRNLFPPAVQQLGARFRMNCIPANFHYPPSKRNWRRLYSKAGDCLCTPLRCSDAYRSIFEMQLITIIISTLAIRTGIYPDMLTAVSCIHPRVSAPVDRSARAWVDKIFHFLASGG